MLYYINPLARQRGINAMIAIGLSQCLQVTAILRPFAPCEPSQGSVRLSRKLKEVSFFLNQDRFVSPLKNMTDSLVTAVTVLGVNTI